MNIEPLRENESTKFERARLIGARALQISMGAKTKISLEKMKEVNYNPVDIAKLELEEGILPIRVKRVLPSERT